MYKIILFSFLSVFINTSLYAEETQLEQGGKILKSIFEATQCDPRNNSCDSGEDLNFSPVVVKTIEALATDGYLIGEFHEDDGTLENFLNFTEFRARIKDQSTPTPNSFYITNTDGNIIEGTLRMYKRIDSGSDPIRYEMANTYIFIKGQYNFFTKKFVVTEFKVVMRGVS